MNGIETSIKYPRTHHFPWSDTIGADGDHVLNDVSVFVGKEVVVTEKLDGENTTLYRSHLHARSVDSRHHPSRDWVKGLHARIAPYIPTGYRINGENCFAKHSIRYEELPSFFLVFAVWEGDELLSWDETRKFIAELEVASGEMLPVVPELYRGQWNEKAIRALHTGVSQFGGAQEGYVVRLTSRIRRDQWSHSAAKYVRPNHVQTGTHWMFAPIERNGLAS